MKRASNIFTVSALAVLFTVLAIISGSTVFASDSTPSEFELKPITVINPVYEGVITEKDLVTHSRKFFGSGGSDNIFDTCEEAGSYLRDDMVRRTSVIEVGIPVQINSQADAQNLFDEKSGIIIAEALKHTGTPVAGDYLKWQYGGYKIKAEFRWVSGSTYDMMITWDITYMTTSAEEDIVSSDIRNAFDGMDLEGRTDYDKVRIVYDWVAQSADYDRAEEVYKNNIKAHTAYNCIHEHSCVCQGFSLLLYRMLLEAGIDNRMIGGGDHIWNTIRIENAYHMSDATWDSQGYGKTNRRDNFLKGTNDFSNDNHSQYMSVLFDPLDGYVQAAAAYGCTVHSWDKDYTVEVQHTDTRPGRQSIHCSGCEMTKDEMILHVWDTDYTTDEEATCQSTGLESIHCCLCGEKQQGSERDIPVNPSSHIWETRYTVDIPATCHEDGTESVHCSECGITKTGSERPIPADPKLHCWSVVTVRPASFSEAGIEQDKCAVCGTLGEKSAIPKVSAPIVSRKTYIYNGKVQRPTVTVRGFSMPDDYKVTWTNGKDVGKHTATVTLSGDRFTGSRKLSYTITPKGTGISKLSKGYKCFTVKWKKQSAKMSKTPVTGYQIRYSLKSSMSGARTVSIKGYGKYSRKISKLKSGKKYYIQVRTYKTVNGVKYCSSWSAKKSIVTR